MIALLQIFSVLFFSVTLFMLAPLGVALYYGESIWPFLIPMLIILPITIIVFLVSGFRTSASRKTLTVTQSFLLVSLGWLGAASIATIPFVLSAIPSYSSAFFEAMSGLTTTGASILTDIESLPFSILFWRSATHWLGGMGIIVLTVALLPLIGIEGVKLVEAEAPGPTLNRITPTVGKMAKMLWLIYMGFTVVETLLLMLGGMNLFDALTHTFGTLATGGFSPKNASVGHYASPYIQTVITIFMLIAGINFALFFRLFQRQPRYFLKDAEFRLYLLIFFLGVVFITGSLWAQRGVSLQALLAAAFQSASILTTTGFATEDFSQWPFLAQSVLFIFMCIGGCAGSTAGGVKVVRMAIFSRNARYSLQSLLSHRTIVSFQMGGQPVNERVVQNISGFIYLYFFTVLITMVIIASAGQDLLTSLTGALAILGNIGPGFGNVGPSLNYSFFSPLHKILLSLVMLLGRLEIYTVVILFFSLRPGARNAG